jgi:hypothetical protein
MYTAWPFDKLWFTGCVTETNTTFCTTDRM